jgi:UDP-N-acetyl-D-glucosamine/UDP-N-acetyl-D-galactosamine dehydrogenase
VRAADSHIAVIGLGYAGLPLAVEFNRLCETLGHDINRKRVAALREGHDATREVSTW